MSNLSDLIKKLGNKEWINLHFYCAGLPFWEASRSRMGEGLSGSSHKAIGLTPEEAIEKLLIILNKDA